MTRYVEEARAAGVKPVLVTSLSRRQWGRDGKIHSTLTPWVNVVKEIAAEKKVPLIDLHARSVEFYEREGKEKVLEISPRKQGGYDGTHLNEKGGRVVGRMVAEGLKKAVPVSDRTPIWRHIRIRNVTAEGGETAGRIIGLPEMSISDVVLTDVRISAKKGMEVVHARRIKFVDSRIRAAAPI